MDGTRIELRPVVFDRIRVAELLGAATLDLLVDIQRVQNNWNWQ